MLEQRVQKLRESLSPLDAIAISSPPNRFYLTGFASSAGTVFITRDHAYFVVDSRYTEAAGAAISHMEVVRGSQPTHRDLAELCEKHGVKLLGFEDLELTVAVYNIYSANIEGVELVPIEDAVVRQRMVKDAAEQELIRSAQLITDQAYSELLNFIGAGRTEKECAKFLEDAMFRHGATGLAFPTIAVAGKNSSRPHGVPGDTVLRDGDFMTMDFGAMYRGYRSDMTRTVAVGHATDEMRTVYDTVLRAQEAAIALAVPGAICSEVDQVARDIIGEAGYGDCFGHGLGHSFGIDIHESPRFSPSDSSALQPGVCITVEPGIYIPGKFGVRIEDNLIITEEGHIDITTSPKHLIVV